MKVVLISLLLTGNLLFAEIDGSKNPELISDQYAFETFLHFIYAPVGDHGEEEIVECYLKDRARLNASDAAELIAEARKFREKLQELNKQVSQGKDSGIAKQEKDDFVAAKLMIHNEKLKNFIPKFKQRMRITD